MEIVLYVAVTIICSLGLLVSVVLPSETKGFSFIAIPLLIGVLVSNSLFWDVQEDYRSGVQTGVVHTAVESGIIFKTFEITMVTSTGASTSYRASATDPGVISQLISAAQSGQSVVLYYTSSWKAAKSEQGTSCVIYKVEVVGEIVTAK